MKQHRWRPIVVRGGLAGMAASLVQAVVGKSEELLLLPDREDSNLAPRLVDRLARRFGYEPSYGEEWGYGTAFHFGYGAVWGVLYAATREGNSVRPVPGGLLLGGLIYLITFPRWGGAVLTNTERRPGRRSARMGFVAASVTASFGLTTALVYEALRPSSPSADSPRDRT